MDATPPQTGPLHPAPPGPPHEATPRRQPSGLRNAVEWVAIVVGALVVALLVKTFLLQAFYIPSASMEPTLNIQDRVLVNKLSYDLHEVHRGDVIVFRSPAGESDTVVKDLIKRVVGLPGETIEARDGHVLIDGRPLREPYLPRATDTVGLRPVKIPPSHYWVMGDNRDNSKDSRVFGPVSRRLLVGRAFVRVWPVSELALL